MEKKLINMFMYGFEATCLSGNTLAMDEGKVYVGNEFGDTFNNSQIRLPFIDKSRFSLEAHSVLAQTSKT